MTLPPAPALPGAHRRGRPCTRRCRDGSHYGEMVYVESQDVLFCVCGAVFRGTETREESRLSEPEAEQARQAFLSTDSI